MDGLQIQTWLQERNPGSGTQMEKGVMSLVKFPFNHTILRARSKYLQFCAIFTSLRVQLKAWTHTLALPSCHANKYKGAS